MLTVLFGIDSASAQSPASAGELVISVESVTALAGDTVTVTLSVTSNPGFSYLRLTVTYDKALTLLNAENGAILKDFDQGVNLMWSADSQSTATGTLVTLTFKVAGDAVQGEYPVNVKFRECYNDNYDDVPTIIFNGSVTVICAHKNTAVSGKIAATCTTAGLTEGKFCADCGEVLIAQEVIPAKGHTEVIDAAVSATCATSGLTEGKHCSVCERVLVNQEIIPALGHTDVIDKAVAPTCTESGLSKGKHCAVCKEILTTQEVIPALGHDYHETRVVAPTCTEIGYTDYTCKNCGKSKNENIVSATGHTFLNYVYNNNASCTQNGTESAQCERCDAKDSRAKEGTMLAHEYEWMHNSQSHYQVCVNCFLETEHGPHRSDSPATEENEEICLDCGRVLMPPLQHVHSMTLIEEKLPTCTKKGNIEHYFCHKCGKLFEDQYGLACVELQDVEIPAIGHKYKSVVTEPTCTKQGYTSHICSQCDDIYIDGEVDTLGHDYVAEVVDPTCTEQGYTTHTCSRCDDTYTDGEVDALGHRPGEWIVDQEPAPGVEGSKHIGCTICGETLETEVIEALPVDTESETETSTETQAPMESEIPTESDSKQEDPKASNGCFGVVREDVFCLIILMSVACLLFMKRREESC